MILNEIILWLIYWIAQAQRNSHIYFQFSEQDYYSVN